MQSIIVVRFPQRAMEFMSRAGTGGMTRRTITRMTTSEIVRIRAITIPRLAPLNIRVYPSLGEQFLQVRDVIR